MKRPYGLKKCIGIIREQMHEYTYSEKMISDGWKNYSPLNFAAHVLLAWFLNRYCYDCNGGGMTGYEEREACSHCDGFGLNWTFGGYSWEMFTEIPACRSCGDVADLVTISEGKMYCRFHAFLFRPHELMIKVET